ncbi:MAG: GntR family transcriptional regulator [Anaerolineales bacterium]|nr:GntR family transcriptional regulator [Anaerolineales bacterium]MBP6209687.1 GntR family transcriptional regulator [Anaerolineales bacterium]
MTEKKLTLLLDFHSGLPIYTQIVNQIQSQVMNQVLKPGDQLPTVRALAQEIRVNFNTVARAYRILDEARIISTQQGRGTYISEIPPPEVSEKLRDESLTALTQRFIEEAFRLGFSETEINQKIKYSLKINKETNDKQVKQ